MRKSSTMNYFEVTSNQMKSNISEELFSTLRTYVGIQIQNKHLKSFVDPQ